MLNGHYLKIDFSTDMRLPNNKKYNKSRKVMRLDDDWDLVNGGTKN